MPGTEDYDRAIDLGHTPPTTLEEWGQLGDYWEEEPWPGRIPQEILQARSLLCHYTSLAEGLLRNKRGVWERRVTRH